MALHVRVESDPWIRIEIEASKSHPVSNHRLSISCDVVPERGSALEAITI
jgi:hypothetical protein